MKDEQCVTCQINRDLNKKKNKPVLKAFLKKEAYILLMTIWIDVIIPGEKLAICVWYFDINSEMFTAILASGSI